MAERAFWKGGVPPPWAESWGWDTYGAWVVFTHEAIQQRLRWIPPGRFLMGSPKEEHDRFPDEGTQREVTIRQGFWLFDTVCTQALWQAVIGDNPSEFKSPDRPVENVDFEDVQTFIEKINQAHPGLELRLPSEAQWEYACRAGTTTPFSFGKNITPEQVNYDGNFPYRDGPKGEYRKQTVPVASLPPNPWGLYEMHGNVWEWCADAWHDTYAGTPTDGSVWDGPSADRVVRGGSWINNARIVRAAFRIRFGPAYRRVFLGFRCVRVHVSQAGQGAEPMIPAFGPQGSHCGPTPGESGTAKLLNLQGDGKQAMVPLPKKTAF
ncbi:MAG: formylglycine-generating enzyme family protein [Nitrospirae bacterium]|nr:formylglycine-generating enzyme family protein [Magnetococcales bacterium]